MKDIISKEKILKQLCTDNIPVYVFDELDSTNRFAKALTDDIALVVANSQSSGRGRLNRSFYSPKDAGIYMSLKIKVSDLYQNVPFITTLCAVAVHKAIDKLYNIDCGIKWVNDIYIGNKKVSGILCEVCDDYHVVIGIGINFYPSSLPEDIRDIATHLTDYPSTVTRCELIAAIFENIYALIQSLPDTSFMDYYKSHSCVLGKKVLCIQGDSSFFAVATDIDSSGGLIVKTPDGLKTLSTGEVTLRITD
ncbi:MAG: biotin--[Clostridia bacterium]|nr:biotin--[acetyl-CoA-carboxylase] ligase [Clostridia bacterium]